MVARVVDLVRQVGDADPEAIEESARRLGASRRLLAPIAWAAGALVLLVRGIRLLFVNWRLTLIQLVPAAWVWVAMWDLKWHTLRGAPFREIDPVVTSLLVVVVVAWSVAAFWCNTVFAYAIEEPRPQIRPAVRRTNGSLRQIVSSGAAMGVVLAVAAVAVPRLGLYWVYIAALGATLSLMFVSFVAVPARIVGARRAKLPPREALGSWAAASALSAVAMTPGFVLDRIGLVMLGTHGLHLIGLVVLSVGTALYAAGMSSVRAVKLTMKLGFGA
jgi:hypothetical protein